MKRFKIITLMAALTLQGCGTDNISESYQEDTSTLSASIGESTQRLNVGQRLSSSNGRYQVSMAPSRSILIGLTVNPVQTVWSRFFPGQNADSLTFDRFERRIVVIGTNSKIIWRGPQTHNLRFGDEWRFVVSNISGGLVFQIKRKGIRNNKGQEFYDDQEVIK